MILVRDVFRVRFGQMKGALASLRELSSTLAAAGEAFPMRVLTDRSGPFYTLVLEGRFKDLASYEAMMSTEMATPEWKEWYSTFAPFLEDGHREFFTIEIDD